MRLRIAHATRYAFEEPVQAGLQQLRLRPKSRHGQEVLDWRIDIEGGQAHVRFEDEHANAVDLVEFEEGRTEITVECTGEVETEDRHGVIGRHAGFVPLWLFEQATDRTRAGPHVRALIKGLAEIKNHLDRLHGLSARILEAAPYSTEQTDTDLSSEAVLEAGHGVCQDHAHVFLAAARLLGYPARYVSGYLMLQDRVEQDASHAWAEAHVPSLGWVGFDVSNAISPDARYVRVATGLDYRGAAPVHGLRFGMGAEDLHVTLRVQQQ
ncbi:MAG: transglutaminase family protein [Pseudomonadota bacterium]